MNGDGALDLVTVYPDGSISDSWSTAGGVAADLVAVTTTTERRRDVADVVPVLDAAGGLAFELLPRLVVAGTIGVEVPLMTTEYARAADRDVVFLAPDVMA